MILTKKIKPTELLSKRKNVTKSTYYFFYKKNKRFPIELMDKYKS